MVVLWCLVVALTLASFHRAAAAAVVVAGLVVVVVEVVVGLLAAVEVVMAVVVVLDPRQWVVAAVAAAAAAVAVIVDMVEMMVVGVFQTNAVIRVYHYQVIIVITHTSTTTLRDTWFHPTPLEGELPGSVHHHLQEVEDLLLPRPLFSSLNHHLLQQVANNSNHLHRTNNSHLFLVAMADILVTNIISKVPVAVPVSVVAVLLHHPILANNSSSLTITNNNTNTSNNKQRQVVATVIVPLLIHLQVQLEHRLLTSRWVPLLYLSPVVPISSLVER